MEGNRCKVDGVSAGQVDGGERQEGCPNMSKLANEVETRLGDADSVKAQFQERLDRVAKDTEVALANLLASSAARQEVQRPARLLEAMRYASLGAGKRLRPFLVVETAALFGVARRHAVMAGAALECIHCYSLVHDDLPAMDNDDLRRGRPTVHKAFDQATAILVGDGLLTLAFDALSRPETHPDPAVRIELVQALARAAGLGGMVGGQMLDLAAEGRFHGGKPQRLSEQEVATLQAMKTGALFRFACRAGVGVLSRLLAYQCRVALDVEEIVGDLKSLAHCRAIAFEGVPLLARGLAKDSTGTACEPEKRPGLHRLQGCDLLL